MSCPVRRRYKRKEGDLRIYLVGQSNEHKGMARPDVEIIRIKEETGVASAIKT
jgi:hypothetical protein